ncbi:MAG TPA: SDR family oxidoreductase [Candidatus Dormibacteraeota bacterium]
MAVAPVRQVVVVAGASAGVGRAIAQAFARRGVSVGLLARGAAGLKAAALDVEQQGGRAVVIQTDVGDAAQVEAAASAVEAELGPIDVWVNNAMLSVFSPFKQMEADEFRRVTDVTYLGTVHGTMSALKRMLPRNRGVIVQVGSALAYRGIPLQSAYCGAKHAIQGFTESIRAELIHDRSNVRITMVQLPALNTPQFSWVKSRLPRRAQPVPPIFQPEVAAKAVVWASRHNRREVWVGGPTAQTLLLDKLAPGLLDWYLGRKGFMAQQTDQPEDPGRQNNLYKALDSDEDRGAHGSFDAQSHGVSWQFLASSHRRWIAAAALTALAVNLLRPGGRLHRHGR